MRQHAHGAHGADGRRARPCSAVCLEVLYGFPRAAALRVQFRQYESERDAKRETCHSFGVRTIERFYMSSTSNPYWSADLLGRGRLASGYHTNFSADP